MDCAFKYDFGDFNSTQGGKMRRLLTLLTATVMMMSLVLILGCSEQEKDSLTRVKDQGEISFAMSGGYPPFNFYNEKNC